jgi:NAD(P)-dependent dehydrogenase (short-subunit alcohol dehydrogenase family)
MSPAPEEGAGQFMEQTKSAADARSLRVNPSQFELSGRVAVVVGATSGIGRSLALGLAAAGADVVATGRREALVAEVATEIEACGRRTIRHACDVTDIASLASVRDACLRDLGRLDILICAAGVTTRVPTLAMTDAEWERVIETNLTGTLRACRIFAEPMLAQHDGRIITIASLSSFVGFFEVAAYTASKSAVAGLTRALAVEWAPHGVRVNALVPGVFATDLNRALLESPRGQELLIRTPMKRFGRPDELVGSAVFLASDASSFVTGQLLVVDGGFLASGVNQ